MVGFRWDPWGHPVLLEAQMRARPLRPRFCRKLNGSEIDLDLQAAHSLAQGVVARRVAGICISVCSHKPKMVVLQLSGFYCTG